MLHLYLGAGGKLGPMYETLYAHKLLGVTPHGFLFRVTPCTTLHPFCNTPTFPTLCDKKLHLQYCDNLLHCPNLTCNLICSRFTVQ